MNGMVAEGDSSKELISIAEAGGGDRGSLLEPDERPEAYEGRREEQGPQHLV